MFLTIRPLQTMQFPTLEAHFVANAAAMLPMKYPGETDDGRMDRSSWNFLRPWPTLDDFHQQCEQLQVNAWFKAFLANAHDYKMEHIAMRSGFHPQARFKMLAISLLERDKRRRLRKD
jgi:hypothetical protein